MSYFYKGVQLEEFDGHCHVCGELVPAGQIKKHDHRGEPGSVYDVAGNPREMIGFGHPTLTPGQEKLLDGIVVKMAQARGVT